ncbi:MAG: alpha/beta hydrolase [Pseudomonadota bacterium]|nr:alpha/beta hydrolase [Pseudomonadota bacterium]
MNDANPSRHRPIPDGEPRRERVFFTAAGRRLAGEIIRPPRRHARGFPADDHRPPGEGAKGAGGAWTERRDAARPGRAARDAEVRRGGQGGKEARSVDDRRVGDDGGAARADHERPWLVFLHEGLGSVGQWRDFPAALCGETGLAGLVYDRWGYGESEACEEMGDSGYLHHEAQESLPQVLDRFDIPRAIFIGHSDGGSIALIFGATFPERAAGIITEAAHVFVEEITLAGIRAAVAAYEGTDLPARLARYHGARTDLVFRRWSETWLSPPFRAWNIEGLLSRIRCPVLAIQGEEDPYGTSGQVESIVRRISGPAEGLIVPRCGHIPHLQAREETTEAMREFIRRRLSDPRNHPGLDPAPAAGAISNGAQ